MLTNLEMSEKYQNYHNLADNFNAIYYIYKNGSSAWGTKKLIQKYEYWICCVFLA